MLAVKPSPYTLQTAFLRLDQLIGAAVERAQETYGPAASRDSFRGLYINAEEFGRVLAQEPGAPLLWDENESGDELAGIADEFGLSAFDLDVLLIAAAPELDLKYERLFGFLQDDVTRKRPTVDLALNLLCESAEARMARRAHFSPEAPLAAKRLMRLVADPSQLDPPLLAHYLKPESQVISYLTGQPGLDARLAAFASISEPETAWDDTVLTSEAAEGMVRLSMLARAYPGPLRVFFEGPRGAGQMEAAEAMALEHGAPLLAADIDRAVECRADLEALLPALFSEAHFRDALLFVDGADALPRRLFESLVDGRAGMTIVSGPRAFAGWFAVPFQALSAQQAEKAWRRAADAEQLPLTEETVRTLGARLKLTPHQIGQTVRAVRCHTMWRGTGEVDARDLMAAARSHAGQDLGALARKVHARHAWDDIVLPDDTIAQLREMCRRVERKRCVLDDWGFDARLSMGKGVNALFSGPSGSGKTMAVEVISTELQLDAYKIDLSGVVSKYIGETEKNLDRIFAAAESANAILFFDEADALFGKRSEVKDSHDRYANIEISYLLQKMEEYSGVAILATNLRQNLDEAFVRRLTFSLHFPFPDESARKRIWRGIWPAAAPLAADVDCDLLARRFKLSGGNIRNIAVAAAFLAADDGGEIGMSHLLHATRREYQKFGKQLQPADMLEESWQGAVS